MGEADWDCASDVLVKLSGSAFDQGQLLQVYPGLLALSSVCGMVTGVLTAALLLRFCVRSILTRQGCNTRRLLELENVDLENCLSDGVSSVKNKRPGTSNKDIPEKKAPPVSSDIAAFATRAKVVYPINQKWRPLADGASNPSLHEVEHAPSPLSSSSCSEEDSDEEDEECEGQNGEGRSSELPQSLQNHSFTPVANQVLTLTLTGTENRINLYFLALRDIQQNYIQLQEEKDVVYSQIMKSLFGAHSLKKKQESDFCKTILQTQEKELSELKKQFPICMSAPEKSEGAVVTLEEIERSQKELLDHGLQRCKGFSKQVEDLCQLLLRNSNIFHPEESHEMISSITMNLLLLENKLKTSLDSLLSDVHEKVLWLEELTALLQTQPVLLKRETIIRQNLISKVLEQMTSNGVLTFSQMEKVLSEIQEAQSDGLKQHHQECVKKTSDLVMEKMSQLGTKRKMMLKNQSKERRILAQVQRDLEGVRKVQELAQRHRQQLKDLEMQQELRLTEIITDLWTSLRSSWSEHLTGQCRSLLLSLLSSESDLTQAQAKRLWSDLEETLGPQLHEAESSIRDQLQETREKLHREGQMWREDIVLVEARLKHLCDLQTSSLQELVLRQSCSMHNQTSQLLPLKHLHLMGALWRLFVVRHVSLNLLKEMRLSRLSAFSETDCTAAPSNKQRHDMLTVEGSIDGLMQRRYAEGRLLEKSLKQEFLSELDSGADVLQCHLQTIVGNALSHSIQHQIERKHTDLSSLDYNIKCRLTEVASKSVFLTKDSVTALVQKYYSQLQKIIAQLQMEPARLSDDEKPEQSSAQIMKSFLKELQNWSRKPRSSEFQQRVEQHKGRLLVQMNREQHRLWEELRLRKITRDIVLDKIKDQLMEAEERFIEELAALAHVSLPKEETEQSEEQEDNICEKAIMPSSAC